MDNLPHHIITDILSRLADSSDLARCRLTCKTLNSLSCDITSVTHLFSFAQYTKSRSQGIPIPFKTHVTRSILGLSRLSSITIRVDDSLRDLSYDDVENDGDNDDLFLMDVEFVSGWLDFVGNGLKMLSVVDFWVQSCWRRSNVLALISTYCQRLNELKVKKAWLSVEGLCTMPALTSLTLDFVRIEDENLLAINDCFPNLQTLNLLGVGGLKEPKICLQALEICQWTVSNAPISLTIVAPKMVRLELRCVRPKTLVLETPMLSHLHLTLEKVDTISLGELPHLKYLQLESGILWSIIESFSCSSSVNELSLESIKRVEPFEGGIPNIGLFFDVFPSLSSLNIGPNAYEELEDSFDVAKLRDATGLKGLKQFTAHLVVKDVEVTFSFISFIMDKCRKLTAMSLLIHHELDSVIASNLISKTRAIFPRIRWKWGFWKEGTADTWVCSGVRSFEEFARY